MSPKQALQSRSARAQQASGHDDSAHRSADLGDGLVTESPVIPPVCLIRDVCRILRVSERQLYRLLLRKDLPLVEIKRFDRLRRFTGESVARCIRLRQHA